MGFLRSIAIGLALAAPAAAQTTGTATLVGNVTDPTGAAVVGAKVTVVNTETSFTSEGRTNPEGAYYIPYLNPGPYQVSIEAAGFKKYVRAGVVLRTNETPRLDVQLEVGSVTESIQVTGAPPLLETETSATGGILEGDTIVKIPVLQKYAFRILLYLPGTTNINGQHVIGQRERSLGYTIDGVGGKEPVRSMIGSTNQVTSTTIDALQEVKLWTTGMPAEFGHAGGGLLSTVFKSGTNAFHGSMEDRYIQRKLIHRSYFEQLPRTNPFTYHEMSAVASGPVYFPKLYNGKDKTFFLFGFQRHHEKASETFIGAVPSAEMLRGDFNFGGLGLPIYDPITTRQDPTGRWIRDPFPGNVVPQSRFDPVARNFFGRNPYTPPNSPGFVQSSGPSENLVTMTRYRSYRTRFDGKLDHQFNSQHKIFGRYSHVRHRSYDGRWIPELSWSLLDRNAVPIPIDQRNVVISDVYTLGPTTINEIRLGFNRRKFTKVPEVVGQDWAKQLGIPGVGPETFPEFRNSGGGQFYRMGPGGSVFEVAEDFTFQENFTKVFSRHTVKVGYETIRTRFNSLVQALPSGLYRMGGTDFPYTPRTGNDFAGFLLGSVVRADFTRAMATWLPQWWSHAWYVQDDFKPMRNLTLNLGLRWSYESPFRTKYDQHAQFDPTVRDPISGRMGAITHPKAALAKKDRNNFQPRVGLAWNFRPKWVFRAGFGLLTQDLMTNGINQNFEEYFATATVQQPTGDPRIAFLLSRGPGAINFNVAPDGSVPFVGTNYSGRGATWLDPNMRLPYIMNWSAGFQYEFAPRWLAELTYQASAGVGLLNNWDINAIPLDISRDRAVLDQIFQAQQNYKPYPQFGSIQHYSNYGHNSYHGGTLRVEKRLSSGVTMNSFYTWSKALDDADSDGGAGGITYYNRRLEKGRANYDIAHRFVGILTWDLPFGKNRTWLNTGGWKNAVLGGWELTYVQTFQSGPPLSMGFGGSPNRYLAGAQRPIQVLPNDRAKTPNWDIGTNRFPTAAQNPYLNIDAFRYPDAYTPGTVGRNTIEAPGIIWPQFSLAKQWSIWERARFLLRWDINNPFKNPNFAAPNSSYNTLNPATFGRITGTRGGFSDIGTANTNSLIVLRLEW
jgi:hypothetical protein